MKILIFVLVSAVLVGCSTGIVQTDKDTYMIAEKAGGCGLATAGGQEADAYRKANAYCAKQKKHVETISMDSRGGIPFARCASAELKFKCVE